MLAYPNIGNLPRVLFFSKARPTASTLVHKIVESGCKVVVVDNNFNTWKQKIDFNQSDFVSIVNEETLIQNSKFHYIIAFVNEEIDYKSRLSLVQKLASKDGSKVLVLVPYYVDQKFRTEMDILIDEMFNEKNFQTTTVFIGEELEDIFEQVGNEIHLKSNQQEYYLSNSEVIVDHLIKLLFSFGSGGKRKAYISSPTSLEEILKLDQRIINNHPVVLTKETFSVDEELRSDYDIKIQFHKAYPINEKVNESESKVKKLVVIEGNNVDNIDEYVELINPKLLNKNKQNIKLKHDRGHVFSRISKLKFNRNFKLPIFTLLVFLVFIPLIFLVIGNINSKVIPSIYFTRPNVSKNFTRVFYPATTLGGKYYYLLSKVPVLGLIYADGYTRIQLANRINRSVILFSSSTAYFSEIESALFNEKIYDLPYISRNLSLSLSELDRELGLIEAEFPGEINGIVEMKNYIKNYYVLSENLVDLLGEESTKYYAIILANNLQPRPSIGKIESVGIIRVHDGRISDIKIYSDSELDDKLLGHVDPPDNLINYYEDNESWKIEDATWSYDFDESAKSIEWFIEKELNISISGVLLVDLFTVKNVLSESNELPFDGYEVDKTLEYAATDERVFNNYLDAFIDSVITKGKLLNPTILESINSGNALIYTSNESINNTIKGIYEDSDVCGSNCYEDFVGIYETTLDDTNIMNIEREVDTIVYMENGKLSRKLELKFNNTSSSDKYFSQIQIVIPRGSIFKEVNVEGGNIKNTIHKVEPVVKHTSTATIGSIEVNIPSDTEISFTFEWEGFTLLNLDYSGNYRLSFNKQSGVISYPLSMSVHVPEELKLSVLSDTALTNGGELGYNTNASDKETIRINWE